MGLYNVPFVIFCWILEWDNLIKLPNIEYLVLVEIDVVCA